MQYKKFLFLFSFILIFNTAYNQGIYNAVQFSAPVDFEMLLSGNYGELRATHFHAGIDIKTDGVVGKNVYAIENGYVSRIKVSANSYGKTVYINHPNGFTSVYAHLDSFNDNIEQIVKNIQYSNKEFEVNYFPKSDEIIINKGDIIGLSGNTGSSSGPHLHFEIRETNSQVPLNPLKFSFEIKDNIAPVFYNLVIYPLDRISTINGSNAKKVIPLKKINGIYSIENPESITLSGNFGFGVEIYDFLNNSRNRCGVYTLQYMLNNQMLFKQTVDRIAFSNAGYIKSHMDYEEKLLSKKSIHKLFVDPNNNLKIYDTLVNRGIFNINKDTSFIAEIIATDVYNNTSKLEFRFLGKKIEKMELNMDSIPENLMNWNSSNTFIDDEIKIDIPEGALYKNLNFEYSKNKTNNKYYSNLHRVHNIYTPVHKAFTISIKTKNLSNDLKEKAFIAQLLDDDKINPIGGEVINGNIVAETKSFGNYVVMVDTEAPEITPLNDENNLVENNVIQFKILDELSGIKSYNGFIDNEWALFEYDQKNDLLFYIIDKERIEKNTKHELELFVIDNNNNVSTYYTTFYW